MRAAPASCPTSAGPGSSLRRASRAASSRARRRAGRASVRSCLRAKARKSALVTICSTRRPEVLELFAKGVHGVRARIAAAAGSWSAQDVLRSFAEGKSTKKISSKLPRRESSGGRRSTSLAVAATKTSERRSWSQVKNAPNTRACPASLGPLAQALLDLVDPQDHRRDGLGHARRLAQGLLRRRHREDVGKSRRTSGNPRTRAAALLTSDLPQPWTPQTSIPRARPGRTRAPLVERQDARRSHALRTSSPPTSSIETSGWMSSSVELRRRAPLFSATTRASARPRSSMRHARAGTHAQISSW